MPCWRLTRGCRGRACRACFRTLHGDATMSGPSQSPEKLWEEALKLYFAKNALGSEPWNRKADDLFAAADLVEPELRRRWDEVKRSWRGEPVPLLGLHGIYLMLMAYGIENLCKGRIVASLSKSAKNEIEAGKLPGFLKNHHLAQLAREGGLTLDPNEEGQLDRLERAATSFGRYPIPTSSSGVNKPEKPTRQKMDANQIIEADFAVTRAIADRLR